MNSLIPNIAWRYLKFKRKDKNISLMIKICFAGIFIGTFSLMLTLVITNGFEKTIHEKMQGINAQIIINSLKDEFSNEVEGISASSTRQIILDKNKKQTLLFIKGIEPQHENKVTNIEEKIIPKTESSSFQNGLLQNLLTENQIIIGYKIAESFGIQLGDTITILIPESGSLSKIFLRREKAIVAGFFNVGLDEYDSGFAFSSLEFLNNLFEEIGADQISLKLKNAPLPLTSFLSFDFYKKLLNIFSKESLAESFIPKLKRRLSNFNIYSWKDLYPALVSSLKLEKYVMFFILALITLVASMNMISLLFIQIQQKKRDVAIFKTLGMPGGKIGNIFLIIGMTITFLASTLGLALAAIAGFFLEKYPFIELPDVYYVSHLPARMEPEIFIAVFICIMLLGFLATWIPARRAKRIKITNVLRME